MENNDYKNILIERLDISFNYIKLLKKMNINTLEDLLKTSDFSLCEGLKELDIIPVDYHLANLKKQVHYLGYLFETEREYIIKNNIDEEVALVKLEDLDVRKKILKVFDRRKMGILYELLIYDYNTICSRFYFNKNDIKELKDAVHKYGVFFKGEKLLVQEKIDFKKKQGIVLIGDDLGLDDKTSDVLYKNDIFTTEDLVFYGPKVFSIVGLGPVKKKNIEDGMKRKGVEFINLNDRDDIKTMRSEIKKENKKIQEGIRKKEELIRECSQLLIEQRKLLSSNEELDCRLIEMMEIIQSLLGGNKRGKR